MSKDGRDGLSWAGRSGGAEEWMDSDGFSGWS